MKIKWMTAALVVALAATCTLWATGHLDLGDMASFSKGNKSAEQHAYKPPTITVVRPAERQFVETLRVNGSLVARQEILIAPQVEGQRIIELHADAGDQVSKGQLLAKLATENLDAMVAQNAAAIDRARAAMAQAESSIVQANAQLKEAAASLKRAKPLSKSGYLSQSLLEQRQAAETSARAALAIARDSLRLAESEKAQAEAKQGELIWRQSRTAMKSPITGIVLSRAAKVGAIATALGDPMFRIAKASEIEFEAEVTSDQLHRLKPGQTVQLDVPGVPDVQGEVRLISPSVNPQTRLGQVRVFVGPDPRLRVGSFATGVIETAKGRGLAIPSSAVMRDPQGPYVRVVVGGKVETRRLDTGLVGDDLIEVRRGLESSDQVVPKAGTFLGDGESVTPIEIVPVKQPAAQQTAG